MASPPSRQVNLEYDLDEGSLTIVVMVSEITLRVIMRKKNNLGLLDASLSANS